MALVPCRECGREISSSAAACPDCGYPGPHGVAEADPAPPERTSQSGLQRASRALERFLLATAAWFFGILCVVAGIGSMIPPSPALLAGACLIIAGLLLLPPGWRWVEQRAAFLASGRIRATAVVVLVVAAGIAAQVAGVKQTAQAEQRVDSLLRERRRTQFEADPTAVLAGVQAMMDSGRYRQAIRYVDQYRFIGDRRLLEMRAEALRRQNELDAVEREQALVARARTVPASNYAENLRIYNELVSLRPENRTYVSRRDRYESLYQRQRAAEADRLRRFGNPPQPSVINGTYRVVRNYLRNVMNDPESLEMDGCTRVYESPDGWVVGCDYRGRNAFGGMVRQSNWFVIRHNRVVEMKEPGAYRF